MASLLETSGVRLAARTLVLPDPLRPWATRRLARLAAPIRGQIDVLGVAMTVDDVARAVERCRPELVVATDSADGRDLMAALAARLGLALVTGVEGIHVRDDGGLTFLRPAWGGGVLAVVEALTVPALATIRPEALARDARLGSAGAGDDEPDADFAAARCTPPLALDVADLVIGVGTGIGGPDGLALVERLASLLGAAVGGTRKVVDAGWLPPQQQIGLSGRQVAPPVYLALGIRGSFNHAVGIRRAGTILAVNPEPRAEIFGECDLGIVADWRVVVEPLIERLAQRQQA